MNYSEFYYNRGLSYDELGQYEQAIYDYNKAIELNSNNSDVYFRRGLIYAMFKNFDKALVDLNKYIMLEPVFTNV